MFDNQKIIENFLIEISKQLTDIPNSIIDLQKNFVYDPNTTYPIIITSEYDMQTWKKNKTEYQIDNNILQGEYNNLYLIRRSGLIKNKFTPNPLTLP